MKETFRGFLQKRKKKQQTAAPSIGLSLEEVYQRQYANGAEENRLFCSKANETEFIVTMYYIHKFLRPDARVIDIGAGLGAYTKKLAEEGHSVDALDLHPENVARMQSAFQKAKNIKVFQADARDLSEFKENAYDLALLMGPIYHLHETEDRIHAIGEALRVVKNGAPVFIAFCLQDAPLIQYVFQDKDPVAQLKTFGYDRQTATVTENTGSSIKVEKTSSVVALIDRICEEFPVVRGALFAQNGLSHTLRKEINEMSDESYQEWIQYLLATAERSDLIGYSNHVVQVLIKKNG